MKPLIFATIVTMFLPVAQSRVPTLDCEATVERAALQVKSQRDGNSTFFYFTNITLEERVGHKLVYIVSMLPVHDDGSPNYGANEETFIVKASGTQNRCDITSVELVE